MSHLVCLPPPSTGTQKAATDSTRAYTTTPSFLSRMSNSTYEAPLLGDDDICNIPGRYEVVFRQGHTREMHIAFLGTDHHVAKKMSRSPDHYVAYKTDDPFWPKFDQTLEYSK